MASTHIEIPTTTRLGQITRSVISQGQSFKNNVEALLNVFEALSSGDDYISLGTALNVTAENAEAAQALFNALVTKLNAAPSMDIFLGRLG